MSSKKSLRKKRQKEEAQEQVRRGRRFSPATLFILAIGVTIVLSVVVAVLLGDGSGLGDPPWPGAVWSSAHGHWH
jgi:Flp pilus assembly protein TadB